jgi:acetate kinase
LCAIHGGRSLDTTMGFTPLEGLVMATRSGSVDPGLLLWLAENERITPAEIARALEHDSGLLGMCGSEDMREVVARAQGGDRDANLALEVYVHRLRSLIAAMAAAMGGVDVLVFTGGVGEGSAEVRSRACAGLAFLGVSVDEARNLDGDGDRDREIGADGAPARTLVLRAREDLEIAAQTRAVLAPGGS